MNVLVLALKAAVAAALLIAGSAKLADVRGFAAAVRLLVPLGAGRPVFFRVSALAVALGEILLGLASLSSPAAGWLNPVVLALTCAFVAVSAIGYAFHRGRSCRCFGALSHRKFDVPGIARSMAMTAAAAIAMTPVPPGMVAAGGGTRLLLLAGGGVVGLAAFSAARALGLARRLEPEAS
jgi:Methylamine utilisation protein MauE